MFSYTWGNIPHISAICLSDTFNRKREYKDFLQHFPMCMKTWNSEIYAASWHLSLDTQEKSEMWSKVSFTVPWSTYCSSLQPAEAAWLGMFYWLMKTEWLLHLRCGPASATHLINSPLELTKATFPFYIVWGFPFVWGRKRKCLFWNLCLLGTLKVFISLPNYWGL